MDSKLYDKKVFSESQPHLIIIPPAQWELNQQIMQKRKNKPNSIKEDDKRLTHGSLLFSGLMYCGYCGCLITTLTAYKRWKTKDGVKHREPYHKYRCSSYYKQGNVKCEGRSSYNKDKIESALEKRIKYTIAKIQEENVDETYLININLEIKKYENQKQLAQNNLQELYEDLKALDDEIVKCLRGVGDYTSKEIKRIQNNKNIEIIKQEQKIKELEQTIENKKISREQYINFGLGLETWINDYENGTPEYKKKKINETINRVVIKADEVEITFKLTVNQYEDKMRCQNAQLVRVLA